MLSLMKNSLLFVVILLFGAQIAASQNVAQKRAERMGLGMNLSYLENWFSGTKEKHYSDFAKPDAAAKSRLASSIGAERSTGAPGVGLR